MRRYHVRGILAAARAFVPLCNSFVTLKRLCLGYGSNSRAFLLCITGRLESSQLYTVEMPYYYKVLIIVTRYCGLTKGHSL